MGMDTLDYITSFSKLTCSTGDIRYQTRRSAEQQKSADGNHCWVFYIMLSSPTEVHTECNTHPPHSRGEVPRVKLTWQFTNEMKTMLGTIFNYDRKHFNGVRLLLITCWYDDVRTADTHLFVWQTIWTILQLFNLGNEQLLHFQMHYT